MQAQLLYDWERNHVEPKGQAYLSREDCLSLVRRASAAAGIVPPSVRFAKAASMPCRAVPGRWEVVIADWGRNPVTVLHEVAHLAALPALAEGEDPHGPAFLAQAIAFYAHFLGLDEGMLRRTAASMGLAAAPRTGARDAKKPPRSAAGGFEEVEF